MLGRLLILLLLGACAGPMSRPDPVLRLHGHNDYLQPVPLKRALELGLGSLEADIFLVDGELRVGHETWQLRPGKTLRSMYLEPLAAHVRANGSVRADGQPLVLLVDIKANGNGVYPVLCECLADYRAMLTRFVDGRVEHGAVTVVLSGSRPRRLVAADRDRLCALDGHLSDLDATPPPPADLVPLVSSPWRAVSDWTGSDELMADELQRVRSLVGKAHAQGRQLRFWGAPDRKEAWRAFFELGIDRIGTDQPKKAVRFMRSLADG